MNKFLYKTQRLTNFYCYWKTTSNRTSPRLTAVDTNAAKPEPRKKTKERSYTKEGLAKISQSAKDNFSKTLECRGVMTNGAAKNTEAMTVRIGGSDIFRTEMAVLGGFHNHIVQPTIVQYDPGSKKAKKLLGEGKVPMAPLDELVGGEKIKFEGIVVLQSDPTPPADEEEVEEEPPSNNLARLGQALGVKANSRNRIEFVADLTLRRAGYQASSSNPVGGPGGSPASIKAKQDARYRKKHTYFKKGCTRKSATFFVNGRTFRHYLEREGLWNKEYIRTLENDKGKKCQLDALLYEQGVKNVNCLDFNYIHYPQPVMK